MILGRGFGLNRRHGVERRQRRADAAEQRQIAAVHTLSQPLDEGELRATYQNVVGTLSMQLAPGFMLSGNVQEVGADMPAMSGVRVEIVSGPGAGTVVTSDSTGVFRFSRLTGLGGIEATKAGYLPWRIAVMIWCTRIPSRSSASKAGAENRKVKRWKKFIFRIVHRIG